MNPSKQFFWNTLSLYNILSESIVPMGKLVCLAWDAENERRVKHIRGGNTVAFTYASHTAGGNTLQLLSFPLAHSSPCPHISDYRDKII